MGFSFTYPLVLLLIPLIGVYIVYTSRKLKRLPTQRRVPIITLRSVVFLLIILTLAGFGIKKTSNDVTTVFVVDGSDSTSKAISQVDEFIKEALKSKKNSDKVSVVNFGTNSLVEFTPTRNANFSSMETKINGRFTNIEQALRYAASLIPSGDRKRIVLMTDGEENAGDALKEAKVLKEQGVTLDIYKISTNVGDEVQIKSIKVPESLRLKEKFEVQIKINSNVKTKATLKLYRDRELNSQQEVLIEKGENNFAFEDSAEKGGVVTYSAEIEPLNDSITQNNKMSTYSYIEDVARILAIHEKNKGASELARILKNDANVTLSKPANLPTELEDLQKYDAFIISNVPEDKFDKKFLDNLEVCIRHMGKGLLVTGGDESYAIGGYFDTVLEKVLPVNMGIKTKQENPNLGLLIVIDKSGSMTEGQYGVSKIELAKEAAIRSTEVLKKDDMIGVIAFDDAVQWVVKPKKLTDLKGIQDSIGTIRAGGGTQIIHPLEEAVAAIKDTKTKLKHIILLTDGQAEKTGYKAIIEDLNKEGITLSTVGVGSGADNYLLQILAKGGKGRFYATDEFTDIPKIFTKETYLAGKKYLNNRTFTPKLTAFSPILNQIKAIPTLDGYVSTTSKQTAKVIFSSDQDDPVLATWQYGLGRTAAWTSDAKNIWASKWMGWDQSPKFWKNMMSWLMQKKSREDYSIVGSLDGGKGLLEFKIPNDEISQKGKIEALVISPSGKQEKSELEPVSPGVYRGNFTGDETGVYMANVNITSEEGAVRSYNSGIVIPYSAEYDITRENGSELIERLATQSGGRIIKDSSQVFAGKLASIVNINDATNILIILIIILLMIDITIRRLNIHFKILGKVFIRMNSYRISAGGVCSSAIDSIKSQMVNKEQVNETRKTSNDDKPSKAKEKPIEIKSDSDGDSHISKMLEKKRKREG